jgi:hypothetical protein
MKLKSIVCLVFCVGVVFNLHGQILPIAFGVATPSRPVASNLGSSGPLITSGLVLNLDASNAASYSGSGTTWTDLSGSGNNGTLTNGPTFNSANGGSIVFDGVDDSVKILSSANFSYGTGDYTLEIWFNSSITILSNKIMFDQRGVPTVNGQPVIYISSLAKPIFYLEGSGNLITGTTTIILNTWYNIIVSKISGVYTLYVNGTSEGTASNSVSVPTSRISLGIDYINQSAFSGRIPIARSYKNKGLSAAEVSQNYNVIKSRFGL